MAEAQMATALSDMTSQPPSNPDAQTTVNDFLDYTEFFPSDLVRSLTLIDNLDTKYLDATQRVHDLTKAYASLPELPASERRDPQALRKEISAALETAIYCRESTNAEAVRIYEVAERHCHRLAIIKRKLQALPQPPSRDPTPAPVSPQATRSANKYNTTPRLHLHFDPTRHAQTAASRPRDRSRKNIITLGPLQSPTPSVDSGWDGSRRGSSGSVIELVNQKGIKVPKKSNSKVPKTPRVRPPGSMGTNVHSQIAGISTSNALARLSPPPPDSKPGSRFQPWFKLTEYEMAVLRKQMKKNAIWSPSDTMIRRELQKKNRGLEAYEAAKKHAEETGEPLLDEESAERLSRIGQPLLPGEIAHDTWGAEDSQLVNRGMKLNEAKKLKREALREQALRDAMEIEDASRQIMVAGTRMKNLFPGQRDSVIVSPVTASKREGARSSRKRKRDSTPPGTPLSETREASVESQESILRNTGPKRIRIAPPVPPPVLAAASQTLQASAALPSPIIKTTTVQVPLAPAGPETPLAASKPASKPPSRKPTPALSSPTENKKPAPAPPPPQAQPTAALSRPRRTSLAPKQLSSPAPEPVIANTSAHRPRSSRGMPTPKAASAEPPVASTTKTRDLRRASNVSLPAASQAASAIPTRASTRRRPPPSGTVTAGEDGNDKISVVKRKAGSKNKERSTADNTAEEPDEPIGESEPRYCTCRDVSYGTMVACENEDCKTEWFHIGCVGMTRAPGPNTIWYCPDCRVLLGVDKTGKPVSTPTASGKRSNRGRSF